MKPSEIANAMAAIIPTRQSILVLGEPGIGKSSIAFQAAARIFNGGDFCSTVKGLPDVDWFVVEKAVDKDPVDIKGLPYTKDGHTHWSTPALLTRMRKSEHGVLVIDELPQALPAVQCTYSELLLDHRIGGEKIPDGWTIIATGNRQQDRAGAQKLLTHVADRVVKLEMEYSHEDWIGWALKAGIDHTVRSFINFKPGSLHKFDPSQLHNTTPRGWERVSILQAVVPDDLLISVLGGCVQPGHAAEYLAHREMAHKLPDPRKTLMEPLKGKVPEEASVLYALSGALVEVIREEGAKAKKGEKHNATLFDNLVTYCERLSKEAPRGDVFGILTMRDSVSVYQGIVKHAEKSGWVKKNKDLLIGKV